MTDKTRRRFLKQSAGLVTGLAATSCTPPAEAPTVEPATRLDVELLEAVGRIVLPRRVLGDDGVARVLTGFNEWLSGFEPVAELDHPYLSTDEVAYGPPDPAPLWASQLAALEIEAEKRHGARFTELETGEQEAILLRQLPRDPRPALPDPASAPHVAIGLLAYFYDTTEANDLGYGAAIERFTCRGLETAADEPASLGS